MRKNLFFLIKHFFSFLYILLAMLVVKIVLQIAARGEIGSSTFLPHSIIASTVMHVIAGGCSSSTKGEDVCFIAGTKILLSDYTYKEIQDVTAGDTVLSYDLNNGQVVSEKVNALLVHRDNPAGYFLINDTLKVTGDHPLWVANKSMWQRADALQIGDTLLLVVDGGTTVVQSLIKIDGSFTGYDLDLEGPHYTYFADNILTHSERFYSHVAVPQSIDSLAGELSLYH
jgi:hypothetical protein